jgi:hypothetical protein
MFQCSVSATHQAALRAANADLFLQECFDEKGIRLKHLSEHIASIGCVLLRQAESMFEAWASRRVPRVVSKKEGELDAAQGGFGIRIEHNRRSSLDGARGLECRQEFFRPVRLREAMVFDESHGIARGLGYRQSTGLREVFSSME